MTAVARRAGHLLVRATAAVLLVVVLGSIAGSALGQLRYLTVLTGSMHPTVPSGSLVVSRPTPAGEVRVGDVVTVQRSSGSLVTHRVIELDMDGGRLIATTKGDANNVADAELAVLEADVWVTRLTLPRVGAWAAKIRGVPFFTYITVALPVLVCASFLVNVWRPAAKGNPNAQL